MALSKVNVDHAILKRSLRQLNTITEDVYDDSIRQVALDIWKKHLSPENPQWKFITSKAFSITHDGGSAHVMAMVDMRLPDIGIVGYFACTDSATGSRVLQRACEWLKLNHGLNDVYGPINGTLPSDYRLNLRDNHVFSGEPVNPAWYIDAFRDAGFDIFNYYASAKLKHFRLILRFAMRKTPKAPSAITVRQFSNLHYDKDFKTYHELRNLIFPFQSIYCPAISLEERIYNSHGTFDADYTYFLADNGREIGFIMAYPYKKQLILKTIGLLPEYRGKHLSNLLLKPVHDHATRQGLTTAIYGMVRVGNTVSSRKHPMAKIFRNYVTMHKSL